MRSELRLALLCCLVAGCVSASASPPFRGAVESARTRMAIASREIEPCDNPDCRCVACQCDPCKCSPASFVAASESTQNAKPRLNATRLVVIVAKTCAPCAKWKSEVLPVYLSGGWALGRTVEIIEYGDGEYANPVPEFRWIEHGQTVRTHTGGMTLEETNAFVTGEPEKAAPATSATVNTQAGASCSGGPCSSYSSPTYYYAAPSYGGYYYGGCQCSGGACQGGSCSGGSCGGYSYGGYYGGGYSGGCANGACGR